MGCTPCAQRQAEAERRMREAVASGPGPYTIVDAARDVLTGRVEKADGPTVAARLRTCNGGTAEDGTVTPRCEHQAGPLCAQCGCLIRLKVEFNQSRCPVGKW